MPKNDEGLALLKDSHGRNVPLTCVNIRARIYGLIAEIEVEQNYKNFQAANIEAIYMFPLPIGAVLLGLEVELSGKNLSGTVVERKAAERSYEEAITDGDSAVMLQEAGPGLYAASIGNLMAHESAVIRYRYGLMLSWLGSKLRFLLPTTIAPRYGDAVSAGLQPHQALESALDVEYPLSLTIDIEGELAAAKIGSPSHPITVQPMASGVSVRLTGTAVLDRDFVLNLESDSEQSSCIATQDGDGYVVAASLRIPPVQNSVEKPLSLRIVIDCSGSMAGTSITQARKASLEILNLLRPKDRFNITLFGSTCRHVFRKLVLASAKNITKAWNHLEGLDADMGGTEMESALKSTFALLTPDDQSSVLLITDGEIHQHENVIQLAKASKHRVFAVGVGNAVSQAFLESLSRDTGGACELVAPQEGISERILNQFQRLRQPHLEELNVVWPSKPVWATALPATAFAGDTVHVFGGFNKPLTGDVLLHASVGDGAIEISSPVVSLEEPELPRIAAAMRVETATETQGLQLSLDYQVLSRWTSYLAIAERETKAGDLPVLHQVPQMLAAGWGGVGHTPSVLRRSNSKDMAYKTCSFDDLDDVEPDRPSEHNKLGMESSDLKAPASSWQEIQPSTPAEFIARLEAAIPDFQRTISLPHSVQRLRDFGLNEDWASFLQTVVNGGQDERSLIATFIYALSESRARQCFKLRLKRLVVKNWKDSGCDEPISNQFLFLTANITAETWGGVAEILNNNDTDNTEVNGSLSTKINSSFLMEESPPANEDRSPVADLISRPPKPSNWLVRIHRLTTTIYGLLALGFLIAVLRGVGSLSYSEDEEYTARICQLPEDVLYKYILIGRTNASGALVADLWLNTRHYGYESTDKMVARIGSSYEPLRRNLEDAVSRNFNLHLAEIRPMDADIILTINGYKEECHESKRRSIFSERFNDFLRHIGLASLLAISTLFLFRLSEKLERRIR